MGNAAHPSVSRTNTLIAELFLRRISQSSVYITAKSGKKKEETSEQLWRKKKKKKKTQPRAKLRVQMFFFLLCCLRCQFDPFNPYLSPLISHTSRKRSILPALACCCLFFFLLPSLLLLWLSCFIYLICSADFRRDARPPLTSACFRIASPCVLAAFLESRNSFPLRDMLYISF